MANIIESLLFVSNKNELSVSKKINIFLLFKENIDKINNIDPIKTNKVTFKSGKEQVLLTGDEQLLNSLIRNLLENAIEYGEKGSDIYIELTKSCFLIKNKIKTDINPDNLDKLFDTFYQVDSSRSDSGFGLGLSIVKKICDIHHFKIKLSVTKYEFIAKVVF